MIPHNFYSDDALVRTVTEQLMEDGRTVLQLWFVHPNEKWHSRALMDALQIPRHTTILSLGCGVGGMEAHWKYVRPDLTFELLNPSQSQLDLCVCPGRKIHAPAEDHLSYSLTSAQTTLASYMLGHVHAREVLEAALEKTQGPVFVLDVFDATPEFNSQFEYNTPTSGMMRDLGFSQVEVGPWIVNPYMTKLGVAEVVKQSTPMLWRSE